MANAAYADGLYGEEMRLNPLAGLLCYALLAYPASAEPAALPAWDYIGGANDDEGWGTLSPEYATCTIGTAQSPVAIDEAKNSAMPPLRFAYGESKAVAQLREQTLLVQFDGGNVLNHEGVEYTLRQLRMHSPSEHSIGGKTQPLELHFIHTAADGTTLIVALLAEVGEQEHAGMTPLLADMPNRKEREKHVTFNPAALLPALPGFFAYTGSLSWPPCTEGVEWRVMKQPIQISAGQLKSISRLLGRNARLHQPLYLRKIKQTIE